MKKIVSVVFIMSLFLMRYPLIAQEGHKHEQVSTKMQVIEGEVLDMVCYMGHEAKGRKHKDCAQKCINDDAPVGILTPDGNVYLAVENHDKKEPFEKLKTLAAEKVKVTGPIRSRGGIQSIEVDNVEKI